MTALLERGALDMLKPLVIETKDRVQYNIVQALCRAAGAQNEREVRKFAAEMAVFVLKNPSTDLFALNGLLHGVRSLGADGAAILPLLKAMKLEDANTAWTLAETIAELEAKVAAAERT